MTDLAAIWPHAGPILRWPDAASWRAARLRGLGASDVPKVLGLSPYGGPWDVWAPRVLESDNQADSTATARGRHLEAGVLAWWAEETGCRVLGPLGPTHVAGPHPLVVTPDAAVHMWGAWGCGEVKTDATRYPWGPSGTTIHRWEDGVGMVREDYAAQVYAQLACTGAPFGVLIVLAGLNDLRWYVLMADQRIQRGLVKRCAAWWATHVEGRQPPVTDGSDACRRAIAQLYPQTRREGPATMEEASMAAALAHARKQRQQFDAFIGASTTALAASIGGRGLDTVTWSTGGRRPHRATRTARGGVRVTIQED